MAEKDNIGEPTQQDFAKENGKGEESIIVPPISLREAFVLNAVNFLKHPNVKGSPIKYRRSFLEKKGLTAEEIDEAFRRVPDVAAKPEEHSVIAPANQNFPQNDVFQPVHLAPSGFQPPVQTLAIQNASGMSWSRMALAIGVIGAGGAATAVIAQHYVLPWVKSFVETFSWGKKADDGTKEAVIEAAKAASEATIAMKELIKQQDEGKRHTETLVNLMEAQTSELKSALNSLNSSISARNAPNVSENSVTVAELRKELRSFASVMGEFAPHPDSSRGGAPVAEIKSELEGIKQMLRSVTSGGSGVRQGGSGGVGASGDSAGLPLPFSGGVQSGQLALRANSAPAERAAEEDSGPLSYNRVLEMVRRGERPPGIQNIDDKPKDPFVPISSSDVVPRPKPWEKGAHPLVNAVPPWQSVPPAVGSPSVGSALPSPVPSSGSYHDSSSWWQRKASAQYNEWGAPVYHQASSTPPQMGGPTISEVGDTENQNVEGVNSVRYSGSVTKALPSTSLGSKTGGEWNPPPPPKPELEEVMAAIRQPRGPAQEVAVSSAVSPQPVEAAVHQNGEVSVGQMDGEAAVSEIQEEIVVEAP